MTKRKTSDVVAVRSRVRGLVLVAGAAFASLPGAAHAGQVAGGLILSSALGDGSVRVVDLNGREFGALQPFGASYRGGVRVATGDVNGDGLPDIITGTGPGGGPHVKVFSGANGDVLHDAIPFDPLFVGGVNVAAGDLNGDGRAELITGAGAGSGSPVQAGPRVVVFDGSTGGVHADFFAGTPSITAGVSVAWGNMGAGGAPRVVFGYGPGELPIIGEYTPGGVLDGSTFAYDPSFRGGVRVATGDLNGDGRSDIITGPGVGGGGNVRVFDGTNGQLLRSFFAFGSGFSGGVSVATGDITGDGVADIIAGEMFAEGAPRAAAHVKVFDGVTLNELVSFTSDLPGGVEVGAFVAIPSPGVFGVATGVAAWRLRRRRIGTMPA